MTYSLAWSFLSSVTFCMTHSSLQWLHMAPLDVKKLQEDELSQRWVDMHKTIPYTNKKIRFLGVLTWLLWHTEDVIDEPWILL